MGDRKQPTPPPQGSQKPNLPPAPPAHRAYAIGGATAAYKRNLRGQVDRACYRRIERIANDVLAKLPKSQGLGDVAAALMLAATAFAEAAGQAHRIVEVPYGDE
jgi:hypothetical protein